MNIALVHDDFIQWGGAERMMAALADIFTDAPIFTSMVDNSVIEKSGIDISRFVVSWMNKLPAKKALNRPLFTLYPLVFESFDFTGFDVVVSSSTRFAHGIVTGPNTHHVAYVHSPFRGFWETAKYFGDSVGGKVIRAGLMYPISKLRQWDYIAGQRPDKIFANSATSAMRVKKYWGRDAGVLYPFVDFKRFGSGQKPSFRVPKEYFLVVSRLVEWKRIDIVVEAFKELDKNLIVVGEGAYKKQLKDMSGNNVMFTGYVSEEELTYLLENAQALIQPQKEDFGMTVIEANYCGTPAIAYAKGGALETVINGETGEYFYEQSCESLREALLSFSKDKYNLAKLKQNASRFTREMFEKRWRDYVDSIDKVN